MPDEIEHMFLSKDNQLIRVRALRPEDAELLVDLFENMGANSRYLRFNLALTDPDPSLVLEEARRMARVKPGRDGAWLAFADLLDRPNAPIGGARYVRLDETTAEAALAVRDDMQNKGIGTGLLTYLTSQAKEAGITRLVATVQRTNRSLLHILHKSPLKVTFEPEGSSTTIVVHLVEPAAVG